MQKQKFTHTSPLAEKAATLAEPVRGYEYSVSIYILCYGVQRPSIPIPIAHQ
jgi:hypothetical protein